MRSTRSLYLLCLVAILTTFLAMSITSAVPPQQGIEGINFASVIREQSQALVDQLADPARINQPFATLQHSRNPGVPEDSSNTRSIIALAIFVPLILLLFIFFFVSLICCIGTTKKAAASSRSSRKSHKSTTSHGISTNSSRTRHHHQPRLDTTVTRADRIPEAIPE